MAIYLKLPRKSLQPLESAGKAMHIGFWENESSSGISHKIQSNLDPSDPQNIHLRWAVRTLAVFEKKSYRNTNMKIGVNLF